MIESFHVEVQIQSDRLPNLLVEASEVVENADLGLQLYDQTTYLYDYLVFRLWLWLLTLH